MKKFLQSAGLALLTIVSVIACTEREKEAEVLPIQKHQAEINITVETPRGSIDELKTCTLSNEFFSSPEIEALALDYKTTEIINNQLCATSMEQVIESDEPSMIVEPNRIYTGQDAVEVVRQHEGELTSEMIHVILEEGYVLGDYHDVGETYASGVGQTGEFKGMTFKESFAAHRKRALVMFPHLESYSDELRSNIISSVYRGGITGSPKTRALLNSGRFDEAAAEFLDNNEYRQAVATGSGVAARMKRLADAMINEQHNPD